MANVSVAGAMLKCLGIIKDVGVGYGLSPEELSRHCDAVDDLRDP